MRAHRRYKTLTSACNVSALEAIASPSNLCAMRLEPVTSAGQGFALLDLVFCDGERNAFVCGIEIDPPMLDRRELSPFIWSAEAEGLGHERCAAIEREVLPWLESLTMNRAVNEEQLLLRGSDAFRARFDAARSAGFYSAAPYARILQEIAPYVYALRFAANKSVALRDACGANGAALIARAARAVKADLESGERNALAGQWFGIDAFGEISGGCDVAIGDLDAPLRIDLSGQRGDIVEVATPLPPDVLVAFETSQSPAARRFAIVTPSQTLWPAVPIVQPSFGGSAGRVALLLRDDFERVPDADSDEAFALARRLSAEGLSPEVVSLARFAPGGWDVVHAFVTRDAAAFAAPIAAARSAGKPVVATVTLPAAETAWAQYTLPVVLRASRDETMLEDHLALIEQRKLETAEMPLPKAETGAHLEPLRHVLAGVAAVLVANDADRAALMTSGLYASPVVCAGYLPPLDDAAPMTARAGNGDFVFCFAPLEARSNQFLLLRAAAAAGLPLVIAGPRADADYARRLQWYAPPETVFLPNLSAAEAASLYRSARVYADVSWERSGLSRVAAAAISGCALVLSKTGAVPWGGPVWDADPASQREISSALHEAWTAALESRPGLSALAERTAAAHRSPDPLVTTAQTYAKAASAAAARA